MSDFKFIKSGTDGNTSIISVNRPEVYNALCGEAKKEIIDAIRISNNDPNIFSIILTGEGKAFSTGQDLNDRTIQGNKGPIDLGHTLETEWNPLINTIRFSQKVVIGAINGICAGAGLSIALACDLLVAKPNLKFISGFSKLGLAPDAGSTFNLVKGLGAKKTLEFFLFNESLSSEDLKQANLINYLHDDPLAFAKELALKINYLAPNSSRMIKSNIHFALDSNYKDSVNREVITQRFLGNTQDYQEGLAAFFEKRAPKFKGV